jgi:hypothetical protein
MLNKIILISREKPREVLLMVLYISATVFLFLYGSVEIYQEIRIDASYTKVDGEVISTSRFFWINQSVRIAFAKNDIQQIRRIKIFSTSIFLKPKDIVSLRVSTVNPKWFSLNVEISNRIIPSLIYIFLSLTFGFLLFPAIRRRLYREY